MASQNKITEMIAAIKTIYPYYAKDANVSILVKTWMALLNDYPDDVVEAAFFQALKVCKMPPTPADIIEKIKEMQASLEPTIEELWDTYITQLKKDSDLQNDSIIHMLIQPGFHKASKHEINSMSYGLTFPTRCSNISAQKAS